VTTDAKGIAALLTVLIRRPVIDETGLTGYCPVYLEWSPGATSEEAIIAALKDRVGLELESKSGSLPVFVIERTERPIRN